MAIKQFASWSIGLTISMKVNLSNHNHFIVLNNNIRAQIRSYCYETVSQKEDV